VRGVWGAEGPAFLANDGNEAPSCERRGYFTHFRAKGRPDEAGPERAGSSRGPLRSPTPATPRRGPLEFNEQVPSDRPLARSEGPRMTRRGGGIGALLRAALLPGAPPAL